MSPNTIRYVWKIPKPADPNVAARIMNAAYQTAIQTDPNVCEVLIRSNIHASTYTRGAYRKDGPHITVATKNKAQQKNETHEASHGYTNSIQSSVVTSVRPSGFVKPDATVDAAGKKVWPKGLPWEDK